MKQQQDAVLHKHLKHVQMTCRFPLEESEFISPTTSLPADLQGGLGGVHCPSEAGVFSDVGQSHHTVVVGDQDDINGWQIQQFSLWLL